MKKKNFFWIGYSDLMTSLFFVMLVLFVVTVGILQIGKKATEQQLKKIDELQTAVQELPEEYFSYQSQYKRFRLNEQIQFDTLSSVIKQSDHDYLINVGYSISNLINNLSENNDYKDFDIKYLVVIEGMASKDSYRYNFELSYQRALSLYRLWNNNGISFNPEICEVQIAGSGTEGVREYSGNEEYKNQQFLIHVIPKLGKINDEVE